MKIPLLITSSVYVSSPFVEIKDTERRIVLTLDAIKEWIRIDPDIEIVICDGSGFDFKPYVQKDFPYSNIECLSFNNNAGLTQIHGKGYGEGEIINYALSNSVFIKKEGYFAKCTSKYWVENYLECIKGFNGFFNCEKYYAHRFLNKVISCQTIFYISEIGFYKKNFATCFMRVDDYNGYFLEHAFNDAIIENKLKHITFKKVPLVFGFSGSSGEYKKSSPNRYKGKLLRLFRYYFY